MKINNFETVKNLRDWIDELKKAAKEDSDLLISWFKPTEEYPISIVGGWMEGFSESYADIMCISKSNPKYAMCVKIAVNEGPYEFTDFELMDMPVDREGVVDDTCISLEWDDDSESLAVFLLTEWERIMNDYLEET